MIIRSKFNGYAADGSRRLYKGGGGGVKYDNLEELYRIQAAQAQSLMDQANKNVYPAYNELLEEARNSGSIASQEVAAGRAAADVAAAQGGAKKQLEQQLSSMGVNPNDQKFANTMAAMDLDAAAQGAAAQTGARDRVKEMGYAKRTDAVNSGMGIGSNAVAALNSAGGMAGNIANLQQNQANMNAQAMGNIAALGTRMLGFKCGGLVPKRYREGGKVHGSMPGYAGGGIIGAMGGIKPPAPPAAAGRPGGGGAGGVVTSAVAGGPSKIGAGIEGVGKLVGNVAPEMGSSIQSFGTGMRLGEAAQPAIEAYKGAATAAGEQITSNAMLAQEAVGATASEAAAGAAAAAEAGGAAAAGAEAAATATAMEAGASLAGTLGAAMPWIGGALLIGSALDLFADGGRVPERDDGSSKEGFADASRGGLTIGPGGPKDDMIPTELPEGGFVMPAGAVALYGHETMEKLRRDGERADAQSGEKPRTIRAMTSPGEFVLPPGAVKSAGLQRLERMRARGLRHESAVGIK